LPFKQSALVAGLTSTSFLSLFQDHSRLRWWLVDGCNLRFGSQEVNTKTLPEGATSLADLSSGQEALCRLKTWFMWVHPFNQGPSVSMVMVIAH
jgi:hypothetical protein